MYSALDGVLVYYRLIRALNLPVPIYTLGREVLISESKVSCPRIQCNDPCQGLNRGTACTAPSQKYLL